MDEVGLGKEQGKPTRRFQDSWKRTYTWLSYDSEKQRVFCSTCVTATNKGLPKPTMARQIDSFRCFVESGFNNWKKALYTFQSHERSDLHRASVAVFKASGKETVSSLLEAGKLKQLKENRIALAVLFTSIRYLGSQGLAVIGHTKENSNFEVLLDDRRNDVPELDSWLKREENTSGYVHRSQMRSYSILALQFLEG